MPLGLAGLAIASFLVSGLDLGWVPVTQGSQVGIVLLAAAVPLQGLACVFALAERDVATAAAMGPMAVSWAATGLLRLTSAPGSTSHALGLELLAAAALMLGAAAVQAGGKPLVVGVIGCAATRFAVNGIYQLTGSSAWQHVSGWLGLAVAALALVIAWTLAREAARSG